MAEELRFFVRTAVYAAAIAIVYWFISYEVAGSVLLAVVFAAATLIVTVLAVSIRAAGSAGGGPLRRALDSVTFTDPEQEDAPLELEDPPLPPASLWPVTAGVAGVLVGLGLVYGAWFWVPGVALAVSTVRGWARELR